MPRITPTPDIAFAVARDAANSSMRAAERKEWSEEDYAIAVALYNRLCPPFITGQSHA